MSKDFYIKSAALILFIAVFAFLGRGKFSHQAAAVPQISGESLRSSLVASIDAVDFKPHTEVQVNAAAYGIYSLKGAKLITLNENKRWPIASITKLMTAVVARDLINQNDRIEISGDDLLTEGNPTGFKARDIFRAMDLEKALLLASSNVAGVALASQYGHEKFVDVMNNYAYNFGMSNTVFADVTGLSYRNQSTVEDIARLTMYILDKKPEILDLTRKEVDVMRELKTSRKIAVVSTNEFAGRDGFIGGKTGTTPEAAQNLVSIFSGSLGKDGKIIILLGADDRFSETEKILNILQWK